MKTRNIMSHGKCSESRKTRFADRRNLRYVTRQARSNKIEESASVLVTEADLVLERENDLEEEEKAPKPMWLKAEINGGKHRHISRYRDHLKFHYLEII